MQRERETIAFSKKRIWREAPFSYGEREKKESESVKKERKKERKKEKEKETQ